MHYHERIISKMEVVQPVQPPPKRADAGERNEKMMQSELQRLPLPSFHLWSGVLYAQVTKVKRGQADFIYELSQDVRQHILTHEDNRGMEQKWAQKIICKSPVDKKPSPPCLISRHRWGNICYGSLSHTGKWAEASVGAAWQLDISSVQYCFSPILVDTIILSIS